MFCAISLILCIVLVTPTPATAQCNNDDPSVAITVQATPLPSFSVSSPLQRRFGRLEYLGGVTLTSSHKEFGGFSAIRVNPDGEHFISLSDRGWWLTGRLVHDGDKPTGMTETRMAPMFGPSGRTLRAGGWYDTESLAERDGWLYVGIERLNRIMRYDFAHCGFKARATEYPPAAASRHAMFANLPANKGFEALTFAPEGGRLAGTLIAFSERGLDQNGNLKAFLIGLDGTGETAEFSVKRRDDFDISDSAVLPSGDVLLLERRFNWWTGIAMRLRRIPLNDIAPGALVDGPELLFADMTYHIDNMEGLSVHTINGAIILTLISDDNFSFLQRTLLLQFRLVDD